MSVVNNNLLLAGDDGGYVIDRSVRLRSSASAYFNRTPASAGNRTTWTWSAWVKRSNIGTTGGLFSTINSGSVNTTVGFNGDVIDFLEYQGATVARLITTQVFRDPSAWYHIVVVWDSSNATSTERIRFYVNGSRITAFSTASYPTQNLTSIWNNNVSSSIGTYNNGAPPQFYLDGYLTEVNFIDGQALTPDSFGEYNATTGVWQPIEYAGTYGTNGFFLNFSDPSSTTTLGTDYSGNGNTWTPNNISVTAGSTYDSMTDVPTLTSATAANFATLNPLVSSSYQNITQGNLATFSNTTTDSGIAVATIGSSTGKFYWEVTVSGGSSGYPITGALRNIPASGNGSVTGSSTLGGFGYYTNIGYVVREGTTLSTSLPTCTTGDVVGFALDIDNLQVLIYKNNSLIYTMTGLTAGTYFPSTATYASTGVYQNFGQRPFAYTPPTGFKALHTGNLPEPTIVNGSQYFNAVLDTGANIKTASEAVYTHQLAWIKDRANANNHQLIDSVRGLSAVLQSNTTAAETTYSTPSGSSVAWVWKAENTGVTNTAGSITSTVSANPTAGFSVLTFTTQASGTATVGHGLGVAPSLIIQKIRDLSGAGWFVYNVSIGAGNILRLDTTSASAAESTIWNSTAPTSTVFTLGSGWAGSYSTVAYCFAPVAGYSAFGSYTGNGSADGPFVFTGFRPAFVMIKRTDSSSSWTILDAARDTYNEMDKILVAEASSSEADFGSTNRNMDFLSNGFKLRFTTAGGTTDLNASGGTYIYTAFAENPFKNSLAR